MTKIKKDKSKELKTTQDKNVEEKPKHNFAITILLSFVVLFAYKHYVEKPKKEAAQQKYEQVVQEAEKQDLILKQDINSVFADIEKTGGSVEIDTPQLKGNIALQGARLDDITLANYYTNVDKKENVNLLKTGDNPYFVEYGWSSTDRNIKTPDIESMWTTDSEKLTVDTPVTLTWDNGEGLEFSKTISVDENYMLTVSQAVKNSTANTVPMTPYTKIIKEQPKPDPKKKERPSQQGPIGSINNELQELSYNELKKDKTANFDTQNGWFGLSDKYWLVSSIINQDTNIEATYEEINMHDVYEVLLEGDIHSLNANSSINYENKIFIGAKELSVIDNYMQNQGIALFDKAIDFGWYYFLTKPFYYILNFLGESTANFGIAILIFTIMLRIAMFPIANKSYASMTRMKTLQPKIKAIKEKYGKDKQKMQQKTMELYQKEKISPMGGCLPMLLQIPIFFSLYKVLSISIEMRHAPFFGWINDLSAPDPTNIFTAFGLIDWTPPALMMIGIWPLFMGVTMFLQQRINPKPEDKGQAIAFSFMPVVFTFMMARFAAGLVIYWTFSNMFAIVQQYVFKKTHGERK